MEGFVGESFERVCLHHVLEGLRDGLSHFSHASRVALLYAVDKSGPLRVHDPQDLLRGHELKLREFFLENARWRFARRVKGDAVEFLDTAHLRDIQLAGIVHFGGRSRDMAYQLWFTEEHPDMCSTGPTSRWLEYAVRLVAQCFSVPSLLAIDSAGYVIREFAAHAVRDHLIDERNLMVGMDSGLEVYPILDAVLGISKTLEEGAWPRGKLVFVEPADIPALEFMARFPDDEQPALGNLKHVRKLLQSVAGSNRKLVSDGKKVLGIVFGELPRSRIAADFRGGHGFLRLGDNTVCSFSDGRFQSTTRRANLVQLEEALIESELAPSLHPTLIHVVSTIVHSAGEGKHGCSLILDLNDPVIETSGHHLTEPLDLSNPLQLDLAKSLAKVDGSLHVGTDLRLHGFACLMDGRTFGGESRARGARYNSALRFTAERENIIVVVVSADRPVSVMRGVADLTAAGAHRKAPVFPRMPAFEDWLAEAD